MTKETNSREIQSLIEHAERMSRGILTPNNETLAFFFDDMIASHGHNVGMSIHEINDAYFIELTHDIVEVEIEQFGERRLKKIYLPKLIGEFTPAECDELKNILRQSLRTVLGSSCKT